MREGNIPYRGTFSWIRPDDEENVIEYTAVPIELNGRPLTIGIDRDITEKVKAITEREEALASLAESRRQLSTLMRNLPGMAYRCLNEPGRPMLFVSEGSRELTGYTPTEMTNPEDPRYGDLIHPADRQRVWDTIQEAVEAGVPYILEYRIRVKGGEERWVWERGRVVPQQDGDSVYLEGFITDVTARKKAASQKEAALAALRESETRFNLFMTHLPAAVSIKDAEGRIVYVNPRFAEIIDQQPDDLIGLTTEDVTPPDLIAQYQRENQKVLRGETVKAESVFSGRGGPRHWLTYKFPLYQDGDPALVGTISLDITKRKQVEQERLRLVDQVCEQARQMAHILEPVPAGVLLLDTQSRILEANPVAERALTVLADVRPGDRLTHLGDHSLAELLTSPPTRGLWHEVRAETASDARIFEVIAKPVDNGPEPEQWVLVINEVTKEREIREQLQRQAQLAAVGKLAAGIAHDFNNIMAVIVLYTQMGLRTPHLPDKLRERLKVIDQQARRATDLIQQILDFGGRAMLKREPMDLVPFLKEMVRLLQRTIPEHIAVTLIYEPASYTVNADPTRMQQMLTNLAVNARDAMPDGGNLRIGLGKLTLKPGQTPPIQEMDAGPWIRMTVSDTGTGISPRVLPHMFEPFYTTKAPGEGTGLGMAQVHGIVSQHDGAIDVETEIDEGTTFIIYLPVLETAPPAVSPQKAPALPQGHGEVVLVVEDEATVRAALVESLAAWNYETLEAANGEEALAAIAAHRDRIDVVLSDVVMPVMGGIPLFHTLQEREPNLPMVMLSGHPMENELKDLQAEGLAGWMLKPPGMADLVRLLDRALHDDPSTPSR